MNAVKIPKSEDGSTSSSKQDKSMPSGYSSPSNTDLKKEETGDDGNSQDDMKSETANLSTQEVGMSLRERRTRKRPTHLYSPDVAPAAVPAVERRASARTEKTGTKDMSNWLQCDMCQKWRLVHQNVFADLKKLSHFQCRNLQGVTCKDRDDWGAGPSLASDDDYRAVRKPNNRRINIFAGKYIPGFAAEFSDAE